MQSMVLESDNKDKMVISFLLFYKRDIISQTIFWIGEAPNQVLDRAFTWTFP